MPRPSRGSSFATPPYLFLHSFLWVITCAPFWSRVGGGLCFRSPKPWGPSMSPAPGPLGASAISSCWSPVPFQGSPALRAPALSVPSNSSLLPPPPSLTVIPALYPSLSPFFFSELYLLMISLLHSAFLTLWPVFFVWGCGEELSLKSKRCEGKRNLTEFQLDFSH